MRYNSFYILILLLVASCIKEKSVEKELNTALIEIDSLANRYLQLGRFSGAILVTEPDSIIFDKFYGWADYESSKPFSSKTAFKVGSITELFTAYIIDEMAENSMINQDSAVSFYLPAITGDYTIRDLVKHKSGLPTVKKVKDDNPDLEYCEIDFANVASIDKNENMYSNLGYNILGEIIEVQNKITFQQAIDKYFSFAHLENTYFKKDNSEEATGYIRNYGEGLELRKSPAYSNDEAFSSNGLKTTAKDLLKIASLLPERIWNNSGYLNNDGFSYTFLRDLESDFTVIILSNRRHPVSDEMANSIKAIYNNQPYKLPLLRETVEVNTDFYKDYVGSYQMGPNGNLEVVVEEDSIFLFMGPNKVSLLPQSENQFYIKDGDASIRFIRDSLNEVTKAMLLNGFITGDVIEKVKK